MRRRTIFGLVASTATGLAGTSPAHAAWPERPVTMIVAFPPGGGTDVAARTLARFLERDLGQSVVVLNRGGAGGEVGWGELARATGRLHHRLHQHAEHPHHPDRASGALQAR